MKAEEVRDGTPPSIASTTTMWLGVVSKSSRDAVNTEPFGEMLKKLLAIILYVISELGGWSASVAVTVITKEFTETFSNTITV